jgi:hypothetical protein
VNRLIHFILLLFVSAALKAGAQGTAFNYQGRLNDTGVPANAAYDFQFTVYNAVTNGNAVSISLTNSAVAVSNGLFNVTLDFGPGIFTGTNYWLDLAVRATDATNFTTLSPRQPVLPVPYAIFATTSSNVLGTVSAAQLTGILPASQIAGTSPNQVSFTNGADTFSGAFTGNGAALTNLNGSQVASGTVADARLTTNVALLNNNQTFTGSNQFNGANTFNGANNFTNFGNSFSGSFFGNGLVGWISTNALTVQAVRDHGYMLTSSQFITVTLPASSGLSSGDIVRVSGAGTAGWFVAENSGQAILGNFASYRNSYPVASGSGNYYDVAAAADGTRMYAVGNGISGVTASSDSGRNWSPVGGLSGSYYSVACSANGKTVYAEPVGSGKIQKSTNGGLTWSATATSATGQFIACTADGGTLITGNVACSGSGTYQAKLSGGVITVSTNAGSTWFSIATAPAASLNCLAASSDCTRLVAGVSNGLLYASSNIGATWTPITTTNQVWSGVWMSSDGSKFAATVSTSGSITGGIYNYGVSMLPNTVSTNSAIGGSQGSAVELQYLGNNQFMPVSSVGTLWAN